MKNLLRKVSEFFKENTLFEIFLLSFGILALSIAIPSMLYLLVMAIIKNPEFLLFLAFCLGLALIATGLVDFLYSEKRFSNT